MELRFGKGNCIPLVLLILMLSSLAACGVRGPVKPPLPHLPKAPGNLSLRQIGSYFLVSWTTPKTYEDGTPLQDLQGFEVYKTRYDLDSGCPECNESKEVFRRLDLEYLQQASRNGDWIFFRDFDLQPEMGYRYKVVPFNQKGRQGNGATIRKAFLLAPPPPENLRATGRDSAITLEWSAVPVERAKAGFVGYNIYRQDAGAPASLNPVNKDYWADITFTDRTVEKGKTYTYTLRTVWRLKDLIVESGDSTPASLSLPGKD